MVAVGTAMVGMTAIVGPLLASPASATTTGPFVPTGANQFTTETPQGSTPLKAQDCNGIVPAPGSAPASKTIVGYQSSYQPGSTLTFVVNDNSTTNDQTNTFTINDCVAVYAPGTTFPSGDISPTTGVVTASTGGEFVNPTAVIAYQALAGISDPTANVTYTWTMPTDIPAGSIVCNFVMDTGNDHGGGGNRKAGVCSSVALASPTISTTAAGGGDVNSATASDTATLAGFVAGANPQGTVIFKLWAPGTCGVEGASAVYTSPAESVSAGGVANSGTSPTLTDTGTYQWTASFSGDASNNPVSEGCNGQNESVTVSSSTVTLASPTISTTASGGGDVNSATASDTATLAGFVAGADPQGTVVFKLWAPGTCGVEGATAVYTTSPAATVSTLGVANSGTSPALTETGTYQWTASFSGDAKNNPVSEGCNGQNEQTTVGTTTGVVTPPTTSPGLTITKVVDKTTLVAPGLLTYTVVVANPGTAPATNVVVTDANPPNTLFESLSQVGATFSCTAPAVNTAGTVDCTTPSLAPGATTTFTIVDEVTAAADGTTVANTAVATATGLTPPPATATTIIPVPPVVAPAVVPPVVPTTVAPAPPALGSSVLPESLVRTPATPAATLPVTGTDVRGLLAAGLALILVGLGLFAKSSRMSPERI